MKFVAIVGLVAAVSAIDVHTHAKSMAQTTIKSKAKVDAWAKEENMLATSSKVLAGEEDKIKKDIMAEKIATTIKIKQSCAKLAKEGEAACA